MKNIFYIIILFIPFNLFSQKRVDLERQSDKKIDTPFDVSPSVHLRPDATILLLADTSLISNPAKGLLVFLENEKEFIFFNGSKWEYLKSDNILNTEPFIVYAPSHNLADSIAARFYVPVKRDYTLANSSHPDSVHFAYAIGAPHPDTLILKLSGDFDFEVPHGLSINEQYYLNDDGGESVSLGTVVAFTVIPITATQVVFTEIGIQRQFYLPRRILPSPIVTAYGGDPLNPSDSIVQEIIKNVYLPLGLAQPGTIFISGIYGSQTQNPNYVNNSPLNTPINPARAWIWDGNNSTKFKEVPVSLDMQASSYGLISLDTVSLVDGVPTDTTVSQWLENNTANGLRVPNGSILYWGADYVWVVIDDLTDFEANPYLRIIRNIKSPSFSGDNQQLSIDSVGRVFTISLSNGGSVTFEDRVEENDLSLYVQYSDSTVIFVTQTQLADTAASIRADFITGGDGTVTSVGSGFGLTGGPITQSGVLHGDSTVLATVFALLDTASAIRNSFPPHQNLFLLGDTLFISNGDWVVLPPKDSLANVGGGVAIYKGVEADTHQFKTLSSATGNLEISSFGDEVEINLKYDFFTNDEQAGANGIAIGQQYKVNYDNPYGMSFGSLKTKTQ
jgi:hypothetical protein